MKVSDIETVNHLIAELNGMKELVVHAEHAEPSDFEAFIKLPGESSIRMSSEGAESAHYRGFLASPEFLAQLQRLSIEELNARRRGIIAELTALGVEAEE